jgi:hypothetical protein
MDNLQSQVITADPQAVCFRVILFEMIELAARRAPSEKFNRQESAKWFIYKRLVEDEANTSSGCLEIIPTNSSDGRLMRTDGSNIGHSPSGGLFSASGLRDVSGLHAR